MVTFSLVGRGTRNVRGCSVMVPTDRRVIDAAHSVAEPS